MLLREADGAVMTEDQAKQLWCPFARVHVPAGVINRISSALRRIAKKARASGNISDAEYIEEQEADTRCIGSGCMAWREGRSPLPIGYRIDAEGNRTVTKWSVEHGFCGLAGRP
jgi:hypothetical protein